MAIMFNKTRILVVDDEPNLSQLVKTMLEATERYDVREENRSRNALMTARGFRPHMILLDIDMPGKDGGEIANEMQADPVLRKIPLVFLTALLRKAEGGASVETLAGRQYLAKPVDAETLVKCIENAVNRPEINLC